MTHPEAPASRNEHAKLVTAAQHVHSRIKNVHPYAPDGPKDTEQEHPSGLDVALHYGDVKTHCDVGFVYKEDDRVCSKSWACVLDYYAPVLIMFRSLCGINYIVYIRQVTMKRYCQKLKSH